MVRHVVISLALISPVFLQHKSRPATAESAASLRLTPITMAELAYATTGRVTVHEVSDYVYGGFQGDLPCPPHADLNPRKAFIICWRDFPFRFVFSHEASYCPWFELPSGGAVSFQFFEGNLGWAELFNNFGRQEQNSSIEILEAGPERVKVRWTYYGVNMETGRRAYRGVEDFCAYPNGLIVRRQTFETLLPDDPRGYWREPMELIGMCPAGSVGVTCCSQVRTPKSDTLWWSSMCSPANGTTCFGNHYLRPSGIPRIVARAVRGETWITPRAL